jgi:Zn finger protein HypA/HybF involved in hydrogenase expression
VVLPGADQDPTPPAAWRCERCGYDTGLVDAVYCPECGFVRPRESVFDRERREREVTGRENTLRCMACSYELPRSPVERCPECGSADVFVRGDRANLIGSSRLARSAGRLVRVARRLWRLVVGNGGPY